MNDKLPAGFQFAGLACGIKPSGKPDLSLIVCDAPVVASGVYTQNQVVAAPVTLCRQRTPSTSIRAIVTNSGNANACTGAQGERDAQEMCQRVAEAIGCAPEDVLVMSTGVIGTLLPMDAIRKGIDEATSKTGSSESNFLDAADAILTTDASRKIAFRSIPHGAETIRLAAMAKGAGMIAPNMATMLAVVCTDACLTAEDAQRLLVNATNVSFNRCSVDGHTSTNDTLLLLCSGKGEPLAGEDLDRFGESLDELSIELAKELVADGEGASHFMSIDVVGAQDDEAAELIARTVAASPLVKTAITGGDPNWGRIVSAAGYAAAKINPQRTSLKICDVPIYENGTPLEFDAAALSKTMKASAKVKVELIVGDDAGTASFWSSDLTVEYVRFNSEYTT